MSDLATALLQLNGRTEPAADPGLAAVKLARATIDALLLRLGQTIDARVTAQLAGGLTQFGAGSDSLVLKLETPLPVGTAVTLRVTAAPNGQPAVTVTVQPPPPAAQPALPTAPIPPPPRLPAALSASLPSPPAPAAAPPTGSPPVASAPTPPPQAAVPTSPPPTAAQPARPVSPVAGQAAPPPQAAVPVAPAAPTVPAPPSQPATAVPPANAPPPPAATPTAAGRLPTPTSASTAAQPMPAMPAPTLPPGMAPVPAVQQLASPPSQPVAANPAAPATPALPLPTAPATARPLAAPSAPPNAPVATPQPAPPSAIMSARPLTPPPPASPPLVQVLADPVQAAARQDSVLPLIARLASLTAPAAAALPRPALEAIARVLAGRLDPGRGPLDGKAIRDAVLRAGVVSEPGTRTPADARSALLQLRSALSGFLGSGVAAVVPVTRRPPPPLWGEPARAPAPQPTAPAADEPIETARQLLGHTDAALSRLKLLQLASSPADAVRPGAAAPAAEFRVEVPMQLGAETGLLHLLVERDARHKSSPRERGWRMRFALNFTSTGEVGAEVALLGHAANVTLWAADPVTADALEAMLPELAPALARHGLDVLGARVRRGLPQSPERPPGRLLDSAR